jgi:hypothetical protein
MWDPSVEELNFCIFHLHVEFDVANFTSDLESDFFGGVIFFFVLFIHRFQQ